MTVYVITASETVNNSLSGNAEEYFTIEAVYLSKRKAKQRAKELNKEPLEYFTTRRYYDVEEMEVSDEV